ncbi:MAG: NAD(P)/FAD-dependent oxidoreductase [Solirubrobacteraceae bacterium]
MSQVYDAIVVGARCAGSPTAMLLARRGYRVLLVDKATFPSDTMSTHIIHPPGVAALERWGLLERLDATGCPSFDRYSMDFGPLTIAGSLRPADGIGRSRCPRRIVLDKLLADAAVEAGAELREGFIVDEILAEDGRVTGIRGHARGGASVTERARIVIGADGRHSLLAKTVDAPRYNEQPPLQAGYYAYWSGVPVDGFEIFSREYRGFAAAPTHDGLTMVVGGVPQAEFGSFKKDVESNFMAMLDLAPEFGERVRAGTREERFVGTADLPNFFRKPYGDGWALVGDAGYHKDPITAQGISDAFRDAEALAEGIDATFTERIEFGVALAAYQRARDEHVLPIYGFTLDFATLEPPPAEMQQLFGAMRGNQDAMDDFVSVIAGTVSAAQFFAPDNTGAIMAAGTPA